MNTYIGYLNLVVSNVFLDQSVHMCVMHSFAINGNVHVVKQSLKAYGLLVFFNMCGNLAFI